MSMEVAVDVFCVASSGVQFSSVQFAKINVVLSSKHFRITTQ